MGRTQEDEAAPESDLRERLLEALGRLSPGDLEARGFDAAKIERIRAAIRAGTFAVDPDAVAEAMLGKLQD